MGAWFFTEDKVDKQYLISGEDAYHINKSLRMKIGEELTLCDKDGVCHICKISDLKKDTVNVSVISSNPCTNEPKTKVTLFQALTKGDKMDFIIQKSVELGVTQIVPIITERCISRPDSKNAEKKIVRWQKIAKQAAMQSRRGIIPKISPILTFDESYSFAQSLDSKFVFYENGGKKIDYFLNDHHKNIGFFVGSEGGFSENEISILKSNGIYTATLGKRILRAETAPIAALSIIMYLEDSF